MRHPVLGPIACLIAGRPIARGEEVLSHSLAESSICITTQVLVDYAYDLETAPLWYREDYLRALNAQKRKKKPLD